MKKKTIGIILCAILFLVIGLYIINIENNIIDKTIYNLVISIKNDKITRIFKFITLLASTKILIIISLIILCIKKLQKKRFIIIFNLICEVLLNSVLKILFKRNRPLDIMLITEKGYSFPSGHAMASAIFYGTIIYLINKSNINKKIKIISTIILSILILLIGISRIYLGVHYPTDVIGGYLVSACLLMVIIDFLNKKEDLC